MVDLRNLFPQARSNILRADAEPALPVRTRAEQQAQIERAVAALPTEGPVHQIVLALDELLTAIRLLDANSPGSWARTPLDPRNADPESELAELVCEPAPYALRVSLYRLGQHAHRLTGSIETMRAIRLKAANMAEDAHAAEYRRDVLDKAWDGIGDQHGCWMS